MLELAHFFTNDRYMTYLESRSLYSFWLQHRDWKISLYFTSPISDKQPNWFDPTFEFVGRQTEVFFDKLGYVKGNKEEFLKKYVSEKIGGIWLEGDRFYFDSIKKDPGILMDKTLNIQDKDKIDFSNITGQMLSLLKSQYMFDAIDYYSKGQKILDIGCGDKTIEKVIKNKNITSVDGWAKFKPDLLWDLNNTPLPYKDNSFHTVLALDLIEHLDKDKGKALLKDLKRIAQKNIILLTPLFWTSNEDNVNNPDSPYYKNEYDLHKSLWTLEDFKDWKILTNKAYYKDFFFGIWEV